MKKPIYIISTLIFFIVVLTLVQVVVSNRLSTTGIELGKLQDQIKQYQVENNTLQEQLLVSSSLTQIASLAAELGFRKTSASVFLSEPLPLARTQ